MADPLVMNHIYWVSVLLGFGTSAEVFAILIWAAPLLLLVESGPVQAEALVVLGGGADDGRPERAARLYCEEEARWILISGRTDDGVNAERLLQLGVPSSRITREDQSASTSENAQFSTVRLRERGINQVIIVTSWYHSRRALGCFRQAAPEMTFYSRPSYRNFSRNTWTQDVFGRLVLEYVKIAGYWMIYRVPPWL